MPYNVCDAAMGTYHPSRLGSRTRPEGEHLISGRRFEDIASD